MSQDALGAQSKYKILKNINSGSYGQVQLAVDRTTGEQVAIKLMERGSKITKYVERELINHSHLLHPHIVQVCPRDPRGDRAPLGDLPCIAAQSPSRTYTPLVSAFRATGIALPPSVRGLTMRVLLPLV